MPGSQILLSLDLFRPTRRTPNAKRQTLLRLRSPPQITHHHLHIQLGSIPAEIEPGPGRNFFFLHEPPIHNIKAAKTEVIANRRTKVNTGAAIAVRTRPFVAKDVLPMIDFERANILPLCVANSAIGVPDRDPCALTEAGRAGARRSLCRPGNQAFQRRSCRIKELIVKRKRDIERIPFWQETRREKASPASRIINP